MIMHVMYVRDLSHTHTLFKRLAFESSQIIHFIFVLKTIRIWMCEAFSIE